MSQKVQRRITDRMAVLTKRENLTRYAVPTSFTKYWSRWHSKCFNICLLHKDKYEAVPLTERLDLRCWKGQDKMSSLLYAWSKTDSSPHRSLCVF